MTQNAFLDHGFHLCPPPKQDEGWGCMGKKTEFAKKELKLTKNIYFRPWFTFFGHPPPP